MGIFNRNLEKMIDEDKMPQHIAFIIDGNGRWAKKRGLSRPIGHKYGVEAVADTVRNCVDLGIKYMSFYCFSTENWNRPKEEVDGIFDLLRDYFNQDQEEYLENDIKLVTSGDITKLPKDVYEEIVKVKEKTKNCKSFILNIAVNYGGRDEIVTAVNNIIKAGVKKVDENSFKDYLYTAGLPDPDLIVRTSGEQRTSNFFPYQSVYSEWYFPKAFWPEFNKNELIRAILNYQKRNRRFGAIKK